MARKNRDWQEVEEVEAPPPAPCWLCERPMGEVSEWHHPVPKSRGGKDRVALHPICHQTIHSNLTNSELARSYATASALRGHAEIGKFLEWIANKPADFYVPTRNRR